MANQSASDDIYCTVNNDETSNHAPVNSLKIESGAGQTVRFTVDESGDVTLTNTLERSGTFTIYDSSSSDGDIVQFASSAGVVVGSVAHYAASTKILFATTEATDTTLALRSGKNIKVQMGFDNDGVGTGGFSVESGGITLWDVTGDGSAATWNLSAGVSAQVSANNSATRSHLLGVWAAIRHQPVGRSGSNGGRGQSEIFPEF